MNYKFWAATFTLSGTIIGAGILGLPYAISKSGYLIGLLLIIFFCLIMLLTKLYLGEATLRVSKNHQLVGYAEKFLGKKGKFFMMLSMIIGIYSALIAYLIGEGESFSMIFTGTLNYTPYFAILFWLIMSLLLMKGIKGLKKIEFYGVSIVICIIIILCIIFANKINFSNLATINYSSMFYPVGIIIFALLGFSAIPEMKKILGKDTKLMKKAIIFGTIIPTILYILFVTIIIGFLGTNISEIATLSPGLGIFTKILGLFTMMTSFFLLTFVIHEMYLEDFKFSKKLSYILSTFIPLILFLLIYFFKLGGFAAVMSIGGTLTGALTGILIAWMNYAAKKQKSKTKPAYTIPINKFIIWALTAIFIFGAIAEFVW